MGTKPPLPGRLSPTWILSTGCCESAEAGGGRWETRHTQAASGTSFLSFSRKCISYGVVVSLMYTHKLRSLGSVRATPAPRAPYFHLAICLVKTGVRLGKRHVFQSQNSSKLRSVPSLKEIWTCTPASFCEKWPLKTVARLKLDRSAGVKMILSASFLERSE